MERREGEVDRHLQEGGEAEAQTEGMEAYIVGGFFLLILVILCRDRNYDRRDRGADRSDNRDSKDEFGRLRTGGNERRHDDRYSMSNHQQPVQSQKVQPEAQKDLKQLRAEAEAARKERLEMVKNITGGKMIHIVVAFCKLYFLDNDDNKKIKPQRAATEGETEEDLQEEQEEDMMEALGFSGFNSTKV